MTKENQDNLAHKIHPAEFAEDQNFPMDFFDELDAVFNKWLLPRGKEIPEQLFTICLAYLRSHGWSLKVDVVLIIYHRKCW